MGAAGSGECCGAIGMGEDIEHGVGERRWCIGNERVRADVEHQAVQRHRAERDPPGQRLDVAQRHVQCAPGQQRGAGAVGQGEVVGVQAAAQAQGRRLVRWRLEVQRHLARHLAALQLHRQRVGPVAEPGREVEAVELELRLRGVLRREGADLGVGVEGGAVELEGQPWRHLGVDRRRQVGQEGHRQREAGEPVLALQRRRAFTLLETMLAWVTLNNSATQISNDSRLPMVRFVVQGYLCVLEPARASEVMLKAMREDALALGDVFPDQALLNLLVPSDANRSALAHALPSPDTLKKIEGLTDAKPSDETKPLVGWKRFDIKTDTQVPHAPEHAQLYKRWWNRSNSHVHPMLLWLQRDYVFTAFEKMPAMAGMDDETPFDYDHLVPSAHWANWTGAGKSPGALTEFEQDGKGSYGYTGNCIGNLHVLESTDNRSRGDTPLQSMLTNGDFAKNGLVSGDEKWTQASPNNEAHRTWTKERALAFQKAVEERAFALYVKFYTDLNCTGV